MLDQLVVASINAEVAQSMHGQDMGYGGAEDDDDDERYLVEGDPAVGEQPSSARAGLVVKGGAKGKREGKGVKKKAKGAPAKHKQSGGAKRRKPS